MSAKQNPYTGAALVTSMALYFFGAPIACFMFQSWWPLVIGIGALLAVFCLLMAYHIVHDVKAGTPGIRYRNCSLCGTPILYGPEADIPYTAICEAHAKAEDLPKPRNPE